MDLPSLAVVITNGTPERFVKRYPNKEGEDIGEFEFQNYFLHIEDEWL